MESILEKLLVSDSKCVQEGTIELKKAFLDPSSISALCELLVTSQRADIRHITVVLLRRKFSKRRVWTKLPPETRTLIKQGMISALVNEADKSVKTGIAQLLGQLGKYELSDGTWPEFLQFIFTLCSSDNITDRELGMYTLSITTEMSNGSYIPHFDSLASLFANTLNGLDDFSSNLAYNTIRTMKHLVPTMGAHQQMINVYHDLLPRLLEVMKALAYVDEHKGTEALGILEELIDYAVIIVVPHIRNVVEMCLRIACDSSLPNGVQVKAISIVGWLVKSKGKVLVKHQLITPIIDVLMELMSQLSETEEDEEYFAGDSDQLTPVTVATQTLDLIALNIPADKVVYYILEKIEPYIQGNDANRKKAAFLCLAVLAEGCSECIRKKYLEAFINCVCEAIKDNNSLVKNAAFFALGQFSEHLQPEVSQYSEKLMPLLLDFLNHVYNEMEKDKTEPNCLDRLFYAIGTFCENLHEGLLPYLPILMERLLQGLNPQGWSVELKKSCFNSLEAAVTAVKLGILPYFPKIIEILNLYINSHPDTDNYELRSYALDCLAVVAEGVGEEHFRPLAQDSLQMGLKLIDTHDPDVRRAVFALFGSLSCIMKEEIVGALPKIIEEMVISLQNSDGIVTYYDDEEKKYECDIFGQTSESEENSDEEDISSNTSEEMGPRHYSVENPFTEEKEQACLTLKEICEQTNRAFLPYIEKCFEEVFKLTDYPRDHIRKAAIDTILQFCITLYKIDISETTQALYKVLQYFIPKCAEIIRTDEEKGVVMAGLDAYSALLKEIKCDAFVGEGHREAIMNCIIDVLTHKTVCQDDDLSVINSFEGIEESTDAEQDELLLESACDIIPKYGKAINPDDFALYFPNMLQLLTIRTLKQNSIAQRSFAFGTLAECMSCLGIYVEKFVPQLLQLWKAGIRDRADEVRNNAVFGLGEMILHGKDKIFNYYPDILQTLSSLVSKEPHEGTLDNICGAIAKMIMVNPSGLPLDQVFPVYLDRLPLRADFEENEAVIKSFFVLYQSGSDILKINIAKVSRVLIHIYIQQETPNDETKIILIKLLRSIQSTFTTDFNAVVSELDQEKIGVLHQVFE
ncbi:importin-4-like [Coccinella septempunctata]|uniref:importin-4-like n=1 Tax=Coccinella septempunctata TaxID=41139 RepID=UPI001D07F4FE|nr:importin-4-like [Coccinella septempunctata]